MLAQCEAEGSLYLAPEAVLEGVLRSDRIERALGTVLSISTAIYRSRSLDDLAGRILEHLFAAIPAERGALLIFERWSPEPVSVYCRDRRHGAAAEVAACDGIVERAFNESVAILANGAPQDAAAAPSRLAAPVFGRDRLIGIVYLESPGKVFDRDHLQLVTAVGIIAGAAIENARYTEWLRAENERLAAEIESDHGLVGDSAAMREVYQFIAKVARSDSTVLLTGESGTGKELVARAIHSGSRRAAEPFVAINCAALTETLLESEMFGHERGAFTGAVAQKKGKLELAEGGTVFLDEVGELPASLQAKLLRALQERQFERVGGTRPVNVDIRILAASNRDLRTAAMSGGFRQDLYFRLNVVSLCMPPLRERREDIPALATHFAAKHGGRAKRHVAGVSPEALVYLLGYDWPGNVRELENAIEHAVVLGSTDLILPDDLPDTVLEATPAPSGGPENYHEAVRREKKDQILRAVEAAGGSHAEAARLLGLHPTYLHRLIRNLGLRDAVRLRAR